MTWLRIGHECLKIQELASRVIARACARPHEEEAEFLTAEYLVHTQGRRFSCVDATGSRTSAGGDLVALASK